MENKLPASLAELLAQLDAQGVTDYRRYRRVQKYLCLKAKEKNIPITGSFELTPLCNLDCKMCYVHLNKTDLNGVNLLTLEQWKSIMEQAVSAGMMYAKLTGGECLTYPGFRDLFLFLQDHGVGVYVLSNGLLIDEEMTAFFQNHPPAGIQITLYGASEEGYEHVTGRRVFTEVMKNIRRLHDTEIPLCVSVTPNAYMCDGEDVLRLLHKEGLVYSINSGLHQPREETGRALADAELETYISMFKLQRQLRGIDENQVKDTKKQFDQLKEEFPTKGVLCGAGRNGFSINWQGGMQPCSTFPCDAESVLKLGFIEAWSRTNTAALNYPLPAECACCLYRSACKGCVAEHAAGAMPGHANPQICKWGKEMVANGLLYLQ